MVFNHVSVLLNESVDGLNVKPDGIYIDGTLGGGGHSFCICERLSDKGRLIGIDKDINALEKAEAVLDKHRDKVTLVRDNFSNVSEVLDSLGINKIDGMLLDLGVSSHQLDTGERGFSYNFDAELDMRMDTRQELSAYDVVNTYPENKLSEIVFLYGEERWAKRIAQFIAEERKLKEIRTTFELVDIIKKAVPKSARADGPHPAKRTFQAIRICVNNELDILKNTIHDITDRLNPEGRICVITFHSLEDRIIKNTFRELENPCTCPREFPVCICGKKQSLKVVTRKPITANSDEVSENRRSRSAKLRIAEKVKEV